MPIVFRKFGNANNSVSTSSNYTYIYELDGGDDLLNVYASGNHSQFLLGAGNDTANLYSSGNSVFGGLGNDIIRSRSGGNTIYGEEGDDTIISSNWSASVNGDKIDGGTGNDRIDLEGNLLGSEVHAGAGDDVIGLARVANVFGSNISGNFYGDAGNDRFETGDLVNAGIHMYGGTGNDTYVINSKTATFGENIVENSGEGNDTVYIRGDRNFILGANVENLIAMDSQNYEWRQSTYSGNDLNNYMVGSIMGSALFGGEGDDTISGRNGVDYMMGDADNDTLYGNGGDDEMHGDNFNLSLFGGNDTLDGGAGNDELFGDGGNDVLIGGTGNDTMDGGQGDDRYVVQDVGDKVVDENGHDSVDSLLANYSLTNGIENLNLVRDGVANGTGNALGNTINGNSFTNIILGEGGNDLIRGEGGNDFLWGGDGKDFILGGDGADMLRGGFGNDTLLGDQGNDQLFGEVGADVINGSSGKDTIVGGAGSDTLTGGDDQDTFVFQALTDSFGSGSNLDTITDFFFGDKINLHEIDANTNLAGNQDFTFYGMSKPIFAEAGSVWVEKTGNNLHVYADVNGDGTSDMHILAQSNWQTSLSASDFIL